MSYFERTQVLSADSPSVDAFGRWRTSEAVTLFDSQFQYDLQPLIWQQITATGGAVAHLPNESAASLTITVSASSSAALQTYQYHRYQPGKSQFVAMTFVAGTPTANVIKALGLYDSRNGIFFRVNGETLEVVRRTYAGGSASDNAVAQDDWNLDTLDGSGPNQTNPSGITLDVTKAQILIIDLQWLGVGRVRIGFDIAGQIVYVHEFLNANVLSVPYMTTANLPLRAECYNIAGLGAGDSMKVVCAQVASEGGVERERGYQFSGGNAQTLIGSIGTGAFVHLCSIRAKALFNSIANRSLILPEHIHIYASANPVLARLLYNATLTGGSWTDVDATYSGVQKNLGATLSGGIVVDTIYVGVSGAGVTAVSEQLIETAARYPICLDASGNPYGILTVDAISLSGTASAGAEFSWKEHR